MHCTDLLNTNTIISKKRTGKNNKCGCIWIEGSKGKSSKKSQQIQFSDMIYYVTIIMLFVLSCCDTEVKNITFEGEKTTVALSRRLNFTMTEPATEDMCAYCFDSLINHLDSSTSIAPPKFPNDN